MGPRAFRVLCTYWESIQMVARTGRYYGEALQGFQGVTQGEPLPPTIFNVVAYAVVRHWILLVAGGAGGEDRWGREVLHRATFFYVNEVMVASTDLVWLKGGFDTLTELFGRLGIGENVGKTVGMLCRPCRAVGTHPEADCKRQMMGEGLTYWSLLRLWVKCPDCGVELAMGSLDFHQ